jgi:hypothetical protein
MKRQAVALVLLLVSGVASALAQTSFQIPFPFQAGGKKLPAGAYTFSKTAEGELVVRQDATGKESPAAVIERISQPAPPIAGPRLVFDEVGDFAPSYTEYITVYVLSEVWLPGEDGYRVHVTKGAHKTKEVKGEATKK